MYSNDTMTQISLIINYDGCHSRERIIGYIEEDPMIVLSTWLNSYYIIQYEDDKSYYKFYNISDIVTTAAISMTTVKGYDDTVVYTLDAFEKIYANQLSAAKIISTDRVAISAYERKLTEMLKYDIISKAAEYNVYFNSLLTMTLDQLLNEFDNIRTRISISRDIVDLRALSIIIQRFNEFGGTGNGLR